MMESMCSSLCAEKSGVIPWTEKMFIPRLAELFPVSTCRSEQEATKASFSKCQFVRLNSYGEEEQKGEKTAYTMQQHSQWNRQQWWPKNCCSMIGPSPAVKRSSYSSGNLPAGLGSWGQNRRSFPHQYYPLHFLSSPDGKLGNMKELSYTNALQTEYYIPPGDFMRNTSQQGVNSCPLSLQYAYEPCQNDINDLVYSVFVSMTYKQSHWNFPQMCDTGNVCSPVVTKPLNPDAEPWWPPSYRSSVAEITAEQCPVPYASASGIADMAETGSFCCTSLQSVEEQPLCTSSSVQSVTVPPSSIPTMGLSSPDVQNITESLSVINQPGHCATNNSCPSLPTSVQLVPCATANVVSNTCVENEGDYDCSESVADKRKSSFEKLMKTYAQVAKRDCCSGKYKPKLQLDSGETSDVAAKYGCQSCSQPQVALPTVEDREPSKISNVPSGTWVQPSLPVTVPLQSQSQKSLPVLPDMYTLHNVQFQNTRRRPACRSKCDEVISMQKPSIGSTSLCGQKGQYQNSRTPRSSKPNGYPRMHYSCDKSRGRNKIQSSQHQAWSMCRPRQGNSLPDEDVQREPVNREAAYGAHQKCKQNSGTENRNITGCYKRTTENDAVSINNMYQCCNGAGKHYSVCEENRCANIARTEHSDSGCERYELCTDTQGSGSVCEENRCAGIARTEHCDPDHERYELCTDTQESGSICQEDRGADIAGTEHCDPGQERHRYCSESSVESTSSDCSLLSSSSGSIVSRGRSSSVSSELSAAESEDSWVTFQDSAVTCQLDRPSSYTQSDTGVAFILRLGEDSSDEDSDLCTLNCFSDGGEDDGDSPALWEDLEFVEYITLSGGKPAEADVGRVEVTCVEPDCQSKGKPTFAEKLHAAKREQGQEEERGDHIRHLSPKTPEKKKVHFADTKALATVHPLIAWDYAYRTARLGPWMTFAADRIRFQERIERVKTVIEPVLQAEHRQKRVSEWLTLRETEF